MENSIFKINNVSFAYGENEVLNNISFGIPEGKITTFMGANGCGKSTLFNLMTKNIFPATGSIELDGKSISEVRLREFAKRVAIVHQYNTAPPDITVERLIGYGRTPFHGFYGVSSAQKKEDEEKVQRAMEITNVLKYKDKSVSQLSGGQMQRVWIAMAIAQDTKILFLDEPTTYLDIRYQVQILQLIKRLNEEYGITVVMVLHDINQAIYFSDEILALGNAGKIIAQGAPNEVITEETIHQIYGIDLDVISVNGKRMVLAV